MPAVRARGVLCALLAAALAAACATPAGPRPHARTPTPTPTPTPSATGIPAEAFGMHFLRFGSAPFPDRLRFGSLRVFDMWVRWTDLQPTGDVPLDPATNPVVRRLDAIVAAVKAHGAEPLFVLAGTPAWAVDDCPHGTWPFPTCGAVDTGPGSAWARYVRFLATRYAPAWFESWNEPNLRNGWNDSPEKLAAMQATAYAVVHAADRRNRLLSPSVAITAGHPIRWLERFLSAPGGRDFDVFALHLYPSDAAARAGRGPEWSVEVLDRDIRPLLRRHHVPTTVWDTEMNVGRAYLGLRFTGRLGAAMLVRSYVLQLSDDVARVYWYAADDRHWTGTPLEHADLRTLTDAGLAFDATARLLVGSTPQGCRERRVGPATAYACPFRLRDGSTATAVWATGGTAHVRVGGRDALDVLGRPLARAPRARLAVGAVPVWLVG